MFTIGFQMFRLLFSFLAISICGSFLIAQEKPVQQQIVAFPRIGKVEITTWEKDKDVPRIAFRKVKSKFLIREIKYSEIRHGNEWWLIDKNGDPGHPTIHFRVLSFPKMKTPLIFVTGVYHGGSDGSLETYLVGDVHGKLRVINAAPFLNAYQGGTYVGYLGPRYSFGAVVWNFIWQDGTAHYSTHPYIVEVYGFNENTGEFRLKRKFETKRVYSYFQNPTGPLREFGISGRDLLETLPRLEDRRQW